MPSRAAKRHLAASLRRLIELRFVVVKAGIRLNVEFLQVLNLGRNILFVDEKDPRRIVPNGVLTGVIELGLFSTIRREQCFRKAVVKHLAGIKAVVARHRRPACRSKQRTERPVKFARGARPTGIEHVELGIFRFFQQIFITLTGFHGKDRNFDADLSKLLLQELNDFLCSGVVVERPEGCSEAVRVARFLQEFAGLLRIIGPGTEFLGEINGGRSVARGRISVARKSDFAERFLIDGIVEGFADALVLEGLLY